MTRFAGLVVFVVLLALAPPVHAADSPVGIWVKKEASGKPGMSMKIDAWGAGKAMLTYFVKDPPVILTVVSALDGSEAPVLMNGKPSGETMAITLVDKLHSSTILKMDGKPFGTSKGTFSPDFNTFTVENDFGSAAGSAAGKNTEHWVRK
ncbi:MAG TPA: hypothetical protein VN903_36985 [Polyangia bacterium]|nr:hypothetical protein [Polyangia bacterium]